MTIGGERAASTAPIVSVEWSLGKAPDLMLEVWSTEATLEAVLEALLEDPENLAKAMRVLRGGP